MKKIFVGLLLFVLLVQFAGTMIVRAVTHQKLYLPLATDTRVSVSVKYAQTVVDQSVLGIGDSAELAEVVVCHSYLVIQGLLPGDQVTVDGDSTASSVYGTVCADGFKDPAFEGPYLEPGWHTIRILRGALAAEVTFYVTYADPNQG